MISGKFLLVLAVFVSLVCIIQPAYSQEGSTKLIDGVYTIKADGADVWSNSDSFRYVYTEVSGNAEIVLRAVSLEDTNEWAKIGLMFRQSVDANSAYAFLLARAAEGSRYFQYRPSAGASAEEGPRPSRWGTGFPVWMRIQRKGDDFVGSVSSDGSIWEHVGTITAEMEDPVLVGIAVTSHQFGVLTTGVVDNITINGKAPAELKSEDIGTAAAALYQSALAKIWAREDIDGAIAELKKAVEVDAGIIPEKPGSGTGYNPSLAHYFLGAGYAIEGVHEKAIEYLQKSEAVRPGFLLGVHSTEWWFESPADFNKRLQDGLEKLVAEKDDVVILSNHLGVMYNRLKDYNKAISQFEKSIEIAPNDPSAYMLLAHTYRREREVVIDEVYDSLGLARERAWAVIGPFDNEDDTGFETVYPPESEIELQKGYEGKESLIQWQMNISDTVNDRYLDLQYVLSPDQYVTAYVLCYIECPEEREVHVRIGADDRARMWLNDEEVSVPDVSGGAAVDQSIVPVRLREGNNKVLLKIVQGIGGWGLYFRITDTNGMPFDDIRYLPPAYVLGNE